MFRSHLIFLSIKHVRYILMPCLWMPVGKKVPTGSMKLSFRECLINLKLAMRIMSFMTIHISPLLLLKQREPVSMCQKDASRQRFMQIFWKSSIREDLVFS